MPPRRQLRARLLAAEAVREGEEVGVRLCFRPEATRMRGDPVEDFADLGPELTLESSLGFARVVRLLRAARLSAPARPEALLGQPEHAAELLQRALGVELLLEVRPRSSVRFTVWTDLGVDSVDQVLEDDDAIVVRLCGGRLPVRLTRDQVVRKCTTQETWLEVTAIDRPS